MPYIRVTRLELPCGCLLTIHYGKRFNRPDNHNTYVLRVWHSKPDFVNYPRGMLFAQEERADQPGWIFQTLLAINGEEDPAMIADFVRDNGWNGIRGDAP